MNKITAAAAVAFLSLALSGCEDFDDEAFMEGLYTGLQNANESYASASTGYYGAGASSEDQAVQQFAQVLANGVRAADGEEPLPNTAVTPMRVASNGASGGRGAVAPGSYAARPNLAAGAACSGFTEENYRNRALAGSGDDVQLYTMCGQAFEYYTMYKRAIAQGYAEVDANRTYAAHQQSAQVANQYYASTH
jgi:hypothetical protein